MAQAHGRVTAYVLFLKPADSSDDWERTDLWQSAASIPGVNVVVDDDGFEARRFHAATSGQTALYDDEGRLLFSGGITGSRGHSGDNAGRSAIVSILNAGEAEAAETFVFGCPLYGTRSECPEVADDRNEH
jgi:glyoxylase-like metal-dependent hydrolase (beta-lactamase superfamily II)